MFMLLRLMIHDWWIIDINSPVWEIWEKFVQFMSDFVDEIIPKSSDESVDTIVKNSSMSETHFVWCSPNMNNWDFVVTFLRFHLLLFSSKSYTMTHSLWLTSRKKSFLNQPSITLHFLFHGQKLVVSPR